MSSDIKINTGNPNLDAKIQEWLGWDQNEKTTAAIKELLAANNVAELEKLLLHRLNFGTAGLRGKMGPGYAAMNDLVIIQTSQGLASYIEATEPDVKKRGVIIGFDNRHNSHRFSRLAATAFVQKGIPVYLYSQITPTPFVPFGVLQIGCIAGIMVTASHNPKDDNGYKVYWSNGAQIISPHDKGIQKAILENLEPWSSAWNINLVANNNLCADPLLKIESQYYDKLSDSIFDRETNIRCPINFTFTAMHGVSHRYMVKAFKVCGFQQYVPVPEQMEPDPDFPTVKFPNPEEGKSALDLSFQTANQNNSSIILANDPDADRLAVAEKLPNGEWKVFNGNQTGALLGWWMWFCYHHKNPNASPSNLYMICSTVSSKILKAIAKKEGFNFIETLTGFKWMGNRTHELIKEGKTVLFAFEEAIGYMCGTAVLDKDGVNAAMQIAQLAAYVQSQGLSLYQQLRKIYRTYGFHVNNNSYFICHSAPTIAAIFDKLRSAPTENGYATSLGPYKIKGVRDLTTGFDNTQEDNKAVLPISKSSQMITFYFENGCVATLRTSGTEPKFKYYSEHCVDVDESEWPKVEEELNNMVNLIVDQWMEPEKNGLVPRVL